MIKKNILALFFLLILQLPSFAIEKNLDINELIKNALENNPEIKSLSLKYQVSLFKIPQEKSLDDAMISLNSMNLPTNAIAFGSSMMTALSLSISQKTVYSDKLILKEKIAIAMSEIEKQMFLEKVNSIKMNVKNVYYEFYYLNKVIELQNRNKALLKELSKITQTKYITGTATQQEIIKINIEGSKINKSLIELNKKKDRAKLEINKLIYKPIFSIINDVKEIKLSKIDLDFEKLRKLAYQSTEIKKAEYEKNIAEYEIKKAELETIPDFDFMLAYTIAPDRSDLISLGLSFNLPIWYKDKQLKMIEEKKYTYQAFLSNIKNLENNKSFNLATIISKINENEEKYDYLVNGILPQLQQALKSSLVNYQTGKIEFMSLLDTQREIIESEMEIQMILIEHEKNIAELEFEIGSEIK